MSKFSFVILHYNTIDDTFACVESIIDNCSGSDLRIYIVDNASPNGTGETLAQKYADNDIVSVILSEENVGFAKGNNLGIEQARKDGYADFVVAMNSDTKIMQKSFCDLLDAEFKKSNFAVLGPTIYTPLGKTSINPGRDYLLQGKELEVLKNFYKKGIDLIKGNRFFRLKLHQKLMSVRHRFKTSRKREFGYTENCVLHGCCLVFSSKFFKTFNGFDDRTFLYFEEEILYARIVKSGLKTVYSPDIEIWHKEDGATDSVFFNNAEKMLFVYENTLESIEIYEKVLKEYC